MVLALAASKVVIFGAVIIVCGAWAVVRRGKAATGHSRSLAAVQSGSEGPAAYRPVAAFREQA
jgi:hypothetical protein